jgi:hypothetical protein
VTYKGITHIVKKGEHATIDAVAESAEALAGAAQGNAPFKTGTLKGGIHVEGPSMDGGTATAIVATGGESSEYAIPQHEGTSTGVPATKYMERAAIAHAPVHKAAMGAAARKEF